jgi:hypothetical protein
MKNDRNNERKAKKALRVEFLNDLSYFTLPEQKIKKGDFILMQLDNFYWLGTNQ